MSEPIIKITTPRSSRFPSISLDYAISVIAEASKFGKNITDTHIAGEGSTRGGAFARKKASLGYYGLIEGKGNQVTITDLADKIINPLDDEEKKKALQESFLKPDLFKRLYTSMSKDTPIKLSFLGNLLVRNYSIQNSGKHEFISTFVRSGIFVNLVKYADEAKTEIICLSQVEGSTATEILPAYHNPFDFLQENKPEGVQSVELILENGIAKISVPKTLSQTDAKKLKAQIDILANIFDAG